MTMPKWLENIVFYEVYPASFNDTDGDGIGNINGITEKLEYIKSMGFDGLWLNPCFESTFFDGGYDITDYKKVAQRYGTNEDLKQLFDKAHTLGMKVLLDLVPGHTSIAHEWFKQSCKADVNEYTDRYCWTNSIYEGMDREDGFMGGSINGFFEREGCCGVNFFTIQPALNYGFAKCDKSWQQPVDAPGPMATRKAMKDVMKFWMDMGCDGFRIDMAGSLVKKDEGQKETIKLWQEFRKWMDADFPNCAMLAEWGDPVRSLEGGFHMDFLLHFGPSHYLDLFRENPYFSKEGKGDISKFVEAYKANYDATNGEGLICIPSGNHDMPRISHTLDNEEIKLAYAFILSMPGVPFIYYGDEIGMKYLAGLKSVEGGFYRTGARSPMQWNHEKNCGFSTCEKDKLYIPMDSDENCPTVEDALNGKISLFDEMKKIIDVRKSHSSLQSIASLEFIYAKENEYPFIYKRKDENEEIFIVLNPSNKEVTIDLTIPYKEVIYSYNGYAYNKDKQLIVPAQSASYLKI